MLLADMRVFNCLGFFFFFQAEDGIRDYKVTGVQTCALPIYLQLRPGTNVAMITSLAHVIVTEGWLAEDYIAERCDAKSFAQWKEFVARPENSPEAMAEVTGVAPDLVRGAAHLYALGAEDHPAGRPVNAAIYYGLGVTEHAQGSTMVMGIANLAMATGNVGREGVGVNPLRGQNNVQGSCDMGSFPHELPGYRHISDSTVRAEFEGAWGVALSPEPGLRIPNMFEAALAGSFMGLYCEGEDIVQSDPNTQHVTAALSAMECVVVQDIFLNETAKDRKSTRLNSSHLVISYAVFCLKKKKTN